MLFGTCISSFDKWSYKGLSFPSKTWRRHRRTKLRFGELVDYWVVLNCISTWPTNYCQIKVSLSRFLALSLAIPMKKFQINYSQILWKAWIKIIRKISCTPGFPQVEKIEEFSPQSFLVFSEVLPYNKGKQKSGHNCFLSIRNKIPYNCLLITVITRWTFCPTKWKSIWE